MKGWVRVSKIKEAMPLAFVGDELNGITFFLCLLGKQFGGFKVYGFVGRAVEDDGWRKVGTDIVVGRKLLRRYAHAFFQTGDLFWIRRGLVSFHRREDEGGIEEDERVGHGADGGVIGWFVEGADGAKRAGQMPAGRAATGGDAVGVDTEPLGVLSHPADGGLGIAEASDGLYAVAAGHAVFDGHGHHAAGGEIGALFFKLFWGAAVPSTAEEKDDGRALLAGLVVFGFKDMNGQFDIIDGFVDFSARTGQGFGRVFRFPLLLCGGNLFLPTELPDQR